MKNRLLISLLALFAAASMAYGQGGLPIGQIHIIDSLGRPRAGARVTVCTAAGTGIPCTPLASIFIDAGLTTPAANPLTTDGNGNVPAFYATPGVYTYTVTGAGIISSGPFIATVAGTGGGDAVKGQPNTFTAANNFNGETFFTSGRPWFDVTAFGADLSGNTCSTAAVTNAITAAQAVGGVVFFPQGVTKANIALTTGGVALVGSNPRKSWPNASLAPSRLVTCVAGTAPVITITSGPSKTTTYEIRNLYIAGNEGGANDQGILINGTNNPVVNVRDVTLEGFAQQCILQNGPGGQLNLRDVVALNCLFSRTSATNRGAVEIHAANLQIDTAEISVSQTTLVNAGLTNCALLLDGGAAYLNAVTAEFGEVGFCMTSAFIGSQIINSQSNFSLGHGWRCVACSENVFSADYSIDDSQAAANTYDGFNFDSNSLGNTMTGLMVNVFSTNPVVRYCFNDQTSRVPGDNWENPFCTVGNEGTAVWSTNPNSTVGVHWPAVWRFYADGASATPDVQQTTEMVFGQSTPLAITNFTGGINGQQLIILGNSNLILASNANISTASGAALQLENNKVYRLTNKSGVWIQDGTERDLNLNTLKVGAGSTVTSSGSGGTMESVIVSGTTSVTPGNTVGCTDTTATATGAVTTNRVVVSPQSPQANTSWSGFVIAANTVDIRVCTIVALTGAATTANWAVVP